MAHCRGDGAPCPHHVCGTCAPSPSPTQVQAVAHAAAEAAAHAAAAAEAQAAAAEAEAQAQAAAAAEAWMHAGGQQEGGGDDDVVMEWFGEAAPGPEPSDHSGNTAPRNRPCTAGPSGLIVRVGNVPERDNLPHNKV